MMGFKKKKFFSILLFKEMVFISLYSKMLCIVEKKS